MRFRLVAMVLALGVGSPVVSGARTIAQVGPPTNPPPASFTGRQFVDSRGCVYMRAGYDGHVTWVPRIDNAKQVLCGYRPTVIRGAAVRASAPGRAVMQAQVPAGGQARTQTGQGSGQAGADGTALSAAMVVPRGYRFAWTDGRLNPGRGPQEKAGTEAMFKIWTRTVPMRLRAGN